MQMNVNVEVLEGLERKVTVLIPPEQIDKAVEKKLQSLVGKVNMQGFRPGKVPFKLVRQKYADSVREEVLGEVLGSSYSEALEKESLRPVSMPRMNLLKNEAGHPVEYEAIFEVYPAIALQGLESVEIQGFKVDILEEDIESVMQNIRKQHTKWHEVDRAAQEGDRVEIDFTSLINGETFEGGSGSKVQVVLGSKSAIPGFEEGIRGAKPGDVLNLQLKFPDDYLHQDVAGKEAEINITVHTICEPELPELDDTFAETIGVKTDGLEGLKQEVRDSLEKEIDKLIQNRMKSQVLAKLSEINTIDLPRALVNEEVEKLKRQALQRFPKDQQPDPDKLPHASFEKSAVQRVTLGLLFGEFAKINNIQPDQERVEKAILELAESYPDPKAVVQWCHNNKEQMHMVETTVLEEQIVEALLQQATLVEKTCSYNEFMKEVA